MSGGAATRVRAAVPGGLLNDVGHAVVDDHLHLKLRPRDAPLVRRIGQLHEKSAHGVTSDLVPHARHQTERDLTLSLPRLRPRAGTETGTRTGARTGTRAGTRTRTGTRARTRAEARTGTRAG